MTLRRSPKCEETGFLIIQSTFTRNSEKLTDNSASRCWIIDNKAHMIVNVGYYIVVFILTFSTVIISMYWLCRFKQSKTDNLDKNETSKRILFTLGLCSQLGVTWGFAFFAYGAFRIPAYYIFTVLNSLQGISKTSSSLKHYRYS